MAETRRMRLIGVVRADGAAARAVEAELSIGPDGAWRIRWAGLDGSENILADGTEQTVGWLLRRIVGNVATSADGGAAELRDCLRADGLRRLAG